MPLSETTIKTKISLIVLYLIHVFCCHVTQKINESLRKCSSAVRTNQTAVRAMVFQQMLDQEMVVGKLLRTTGAFHQVFTVKERIRTNLL